MSAIPTRYNGVQFRSRLEARWAAMFDLLQWKWEYEPIDLEGYIPDFIVEHSVMTQGNRARRRRIVEVKPALDLHEMDAAFPKIELSGWRGLASVVGARLFESGDSDRVVLGRNILANPGGPPARRAFWAIRSDHSATVADWREAGNLVQWRAPVGI